MSTCMYIHTCLCIVGKCAVCMYIKKYIELYIYIYIRYAHVYVYNYVQCDRRVLVVAYNLIQCAYVMGIFRNIFSFPRWFWWLWDAIDGIEDTSFHGDILGIYTYIHIICIYTCTQSQYTINILNEVGYGET